MKILQALMLSLSATALGISCSSQKPKDCPPVVAKAILSETEEVRQYLQKNSITAQEDSTGYFYSIEDPGTGKPANSCSDVTVDYEGTLTNGKTFDAGKDVSFNISQLITGWQMGIPKLKEGGKITLYVPPCFAYGEKAAGEIPPHAILIFKIALKAVH